MQGSKMWRWSGPSHSRTTETLTIYKATLFQVSLNGNLTATGDNHALDDREHDLSGQKEHISEPHVIFLYVGCGKIFSSPSFESIKSPVSVGPQLSSSIILTCFHLKGTIESFPTYTRSHQGPE